MLLSEYERRSSETDSIDANGRGLHIRRYGLFSQVGGLLELVKKGTREARFDEQAQAILEETGDVLWYLCAVLRELSVSFDDIAGPLLGSAHATGDIGFDSLDALVLQSPAGGHGQPDVALNDMAIAVTEIMRPQRNQDAASVMSAFLATLIAVAVEFELSFTYSHQMTHNHHQ